MAKTNVIQGDLFNRGFPKFNETYYFFSIVPEKKADFTRALNTIGKTGKIATIDSVLKDWVKVDQSKTKTVEVSNALIAFSMEGLKMIEDGLGGKNVLSLIDLPTSDPAFAMGMAKNQGTLNDPDPTKWDPPFDFDGKSGRIHGLLKVAGDSTDSVDKKLNAIKLDLGDTIKDVASPSSPTLISSRIDGQVRPKEKGLNGHEHFDFEDGVSQPLLKGINTEAELAADSSMQTERSVIIVTKDLPSPQPDVVPVPNPKARPSWMIDGSFLVFRKLAQDVDAFNKLTDKNFKSAGCTSADQFGAKLMGRWKSGAPVVLSPTQDNGVKRNDFSFNNNNVCPLGAHIRKTNPRRPDFGTMKPARIVRNGIPYGPEFSVDPNADRGLLFACYQSNIDNGFQFIQSQWINRADFPPPFLGGRAGFDAFTAQPPGNAQVDVTMFGPDQKQLPSFGKFNKLVTMKGGEYFFVPSIDALMNTLGSLPPPRFML